jgi:hypothetical protein
MVVAINTYNKFNLVTDRINTNSDVTPTTFEYSLYGNLANVDVYQLLVSAGWNQIDPVQITNAGNVYSNIASIPAMTISGEYPYGITLINNGNINGANGFETTGTLSGIPGNAIFVTSVCSITNAGQILGGNSFTLADDGYAIVGISNVTLTNSGTIGDTV